MTIKKSQVKLLFPKIPKEEKNDLIKYLGLTKFRGFISKILGNFNIKRAKYINSGTYGCAFDIGQNKVLKITTDKSEARNAYHLCIHPADRFIKYLDVYKIICNEYLKEDIYVIIMEKLILMNAIEDEIFYFLKKQTFRKPITNEREERKYEIPDNLGYINDITTHGFNNYLEFEQLNTKKIVKQKFEELQRRIKTYSKEGCNWGDISFSKLKNVKYKHFSKMHSEICAILKCAFDNNIIIRDCHAGNIAYRKNKLVIFDLSLTSKRNYKIIEINI